MNLCDRYPMNILITSGNVHVNTCCMLSVNHTNNTTARTSYNVNMFYLHQNSTVVLFVATQTTLQNTAAR